MKPPLPLLSSIPTPPTQYQFENDHSHIASKDLDSHKVDEAQTLQTQTHPADLKDGQQDGYDVDYTAEKRNNEQGLHEGTWGEKLKAITKILSALIYIFLCV
jgi:hypothetical protein